MRNHLSKLPTVVSAMLLSACAIYQESVIDPAAGLHNDLLLDPAIVSRQPGMAKEWWILFGDPVLDRLVQQALRENADIKIALAQIEKARALQRIERAAYLPAVGLQAAYTRQRNSDFSPGVPGISESAGVGLVTGWELDLFGRVANTNRMADADLDAAGHVLSAVRVLTAAEVVSTYQLARAIEQRMQVRREARDHSRDIVDMTATLVEQGRLAGDALDHARAELAMHELALPGEQQALARLEHRLAVLLHAQPGHWVLPPGGEMAGPLQLVPVKVSDLSGLIANRPDIGRAWQNLVAHEAALGVARAEYMPRLTLDGFIGLLAGNAGDLISAGAHQWTILPTLGWNALDFGRRINGIRAADAALAIAVSEYERTVLLAVEESRNALTSFSAAQQELVLTEQLLRHSKTAAGQAEARYREGYGGYLEMLVARRDALGAELARIDAVAGHRLASVNLFKALGPAL